MKKSLNYWCFIFILIIGPLSSSACGEPKSTRSLEETTRLINHGRYLATIGVCEACHTPPNVSALPPHASKAEDIERERSYRTNPDWFQYLDINRKMAGGVPFILRFSKDSSGIVYTKNLTPDPETGLGNWTEEEIMEVIRSGKRNDGTALFRFPPHTFYENLAEEDARALAVYLRSLPPVKHAISERALPFPVDPARNISSQKIAPTGRNFERAAYLMKALVGCKECHSHHDSQGNLVEFVGGDKADPFNGSFRLGPDLPLRQDEKGFATFPFPGYAVLFGSNLTRFGLGGDLAHISAATIVAAMRRGLATHSDHHGRPELLQHVMMWQFYSHMTDEDAFAIGEFIKNLRYIPHKIKSNLIYFGTDWTAAFEYLFGEKPSDNDRKIFGK